jgi:hypothetical protein
MNGKVLFKVSLALNVVLVATLAVLLLGQNRTQPVPVAVPTTASNETARVASQPRPRPYSTLIADSDWRQWVDQLRATGIPLPVMARLAEEHFNDLWQRRQNQAQAAFMRGDIDTDGLAALNVERAFEEERTMRAVLGDEDFRKWDKENILRSLNLTGIQLTDAETDALYELEKKTRQRFNELSLARLKGEMTLAEYEEQQAKTQADHDQELKALLGDQRYAIMHGPDEVSSDLKHALSAGGIATEDVPFEAMLATQRQWVERRHEMEFKINEAKSQISNCEEELKRMDEAREQDFQRVLGTNVFDALERGQDARYQEMKRHADKWGLDDTATDYLYRTVKYYEKAVQDYQRQARALEAQGQAVDWDGVNKNVQQFAQQTERVVRNYLGDERFDRIKSNQIFPFAPAK